MHPQSTIKVNNEEIKCISPYIVSASRATDIPAFYSEWFFNAFERGYCKWINPFNQKVQYVSFENCRAVVFWTKNPDPIIRKLQALDRKGISYYFLFSLNDYDSEHIEPGLPPLSERINTFIKLSETIGAERVLWRFDPILLSNTITTDIIKQRIAHIAAAIKNYTNKLIFSFVEISKYKKAQKRLAPFSARELTASEKEEIICFLSALQSEIHKTNPSFEISTCAIESDYSKYGISHNKCIDDDLFSKIAPDDNRLMEFIGRNSLFPPSPKALKDKGQRPACRCIVSKDIGRYNTCLHFCAYCYANSTNGTVMQNHEKHYPFGESI